MPGEENEVKKKKRKNVYQNMAVKVREFHFQFGVQISLFAAVRLLGRHMIRVYQHAKEQITSRRLIRFECKLTVME